MADEFKDIFKDSQQPLDADTLAVSGEDNKPLHRLSLNGKKFRKMLGGEEVATAPSQHLKVVIVKMAHTPSRTYYDKVYQEGVISSPVCWSSDSIVADKDVPIAQAQSCSQCKNSIRGSGANGIGMACKLSWRIAVVLANDLEGDVIQLVIPAMSCFKKEAEGKWSFRPYIQMLASNNISASKVITKMQFDTKSPTPKILFSPAGIVPEEHHALVDEQKKSQAAQQAVNLTVYQADSSGSTENKAEAPQTQAKSNPEPVQTDAVTDDVEEPVKREADKPQAEKVNDVSDVINKWATK